MKHFQLLTAAAAVSVACFWSAPGRAADMVTPAPPAPVTPAPVMGYSWTGLYVGAQAGYIWGDAGYHTAAPEINFHSNGGAIGLYGGADYEFPSHIVTGVMLDLNYGFTSGDDGGQGGSVDKVKLRFDGALRARIGYAFDRWLVYASGGGALTNEKWSIPSSGYSSSKTLGGWTVGGGVEYAFDKRWVARVDYRYSDFGKTDFDPSSFGQNLRHTKLTTNEVMAGISYRF